MALPTQQDREKAWTLGFWPDSVRMDKIAQALADERERCAMLHEQIDSTPNTDRSSAIIDYRNAIRRLE